MTFLEAARRALSDAVTPLTADGITEGAAEYGSIQARGTP